MKASKSTLPRGSKLRGAKDAARVDMEAAQYAAGATVIKRLEPDELLQTVMETEGNDMELRIDAAKALMPYRHKKKPVDINQTGNTQFFGVNVNVPGLPK